MDFQFTPTQLEALDSQGSREARVIDPRDNATYVLILETKYREVRELLEDERSLQKIRAVGLRNAIGRKE